ncbi:calcium-activated potassium channel [Lynx pardinus]|uniref:Calcium-activated potassium channel subunit beta n=1 Tax=Lynx pardinus TaxID=191816 RepID=A0A485P949_LYNPA|nr:calcium-activated potassium channel [Lynx pardinus]
MFALLYLIFRRCAWMQYMKMGHSGTAGQGTLSPCALKGQIFSSQGHPYPRSASHGGPLHGANCTVLSVQQIGEVFECTFTCGADCRGTSQYPCVQVYVNNSESNSRALLHSDEHQLLTNPKCSYIPPCKRENQKNLESVMNWQQYWKDEIGSHPFTCYFNQFQRPDDVLLHRTHDEIVLLHCFLWPLVTFVVGVLIVVLTICAKSLAVKAEAMKKRKFS